MKVNYYTNSVRRILLNLILVFLIYNNVYSQANLIGVTGEGGANGAGVIYEYNVAAGSYFKRFDFTLNLSVGTGSNGFLIKANNGRLYGTSAYVGLYDHGIL